MEPHDLLASLCIDSSGNAPSRHKVVCRYPESVRGSRDGLGPRSHMQVAADARWLRPRRCDDAGFAKGA